MSRVSAATLPQTRYTGLLLLSLLPILLQNIDCFAMVPRDEDWNKKHGGGQYGGGGHPADPYKYSDDRGNLDGDGDGGYYEGGEWTSDDDGEMGHGGIRHPGHHDKDWGLEGDYYEHGWGDIPGLALATPSPSNPTQGPGFSNSQAGNPSQASLQPSNAQSPQPTQDANLPPSSASSSFPALNPGDLLDLTAALDALPTMVPGQDGAPARLPLIGIL